MMDPKGLSKAIRDKKKKSLRPDLDDAGQEGMDPNEALDLKQNQEISDVLDEQDHEPASDKEMGEDESSQEVEQLKKSSARIAKYLQSL